jgi:hypothetical protein
MIRKAMIAMAVLAVATGPAYAGAVFAPAHEQGQRRGWMARHTMRSAFNTSASNAQSMLDTSLSRTDTAMPTRLSATGRLPTG